MSNVLLSPEQWLHLQEEAVQNEEKCASMMEQIQGKKSYLQRLNSRDNGDSAKEKPFSLKTVDETDSGCQISPVFIVTQPQPSSQGSGLGRTNQAMSTGERNGPRRLTPIMEEDDSFERQLDEFMREENTPNSLPFFDRNGEVVTNEGSVPRLILARDSVLLTILTNIGRVIYLLITSLLFLCSCCFCGQRKWPGTDDFRSLVKDTLMCCDHAEEEIIIEEEEAERE